MNIRSFLKNIAIPLVFLGAFILIHFLWIIFNLPEKEEMIVLVRDWFREYGLAVIFVSALLEGMLLIGNYYPGGLVIVLGVISAGGDTKLAILVIAVVSIAIFFAYFLNYLLGRHGWYKLFSSMGLKDAIELQKERLRKHQFGAIMASYWVPNLASITSTTAGILHLPLGKFLIHSAIGIAIWNSFWGAIVAILGERALDLISLKWVIVVVVIWIGIIIIQQKIYKKTV